MRTNYDKSNDHKWKVLNSKQSSCKICNVLRTKTYSNKTGSFTTTYQDNQSVIHTEYIPCIEKYDDSEFYK
jgi:hypothetical protein